MRTTSLFVAVLLSGCAPEYTQPAEACLETVPGGATAPSEAVAAVLQLNCYRRFAGMDRARVDADISAAAAAHAGYLQANSELGEEGTTEQVTLPSYTGETPIARAEAERYAYRHDPSMVVDELVYAKTDPTIVPGAVINAWMNDPFTRQHLLQPSVLAVGFGEANDWAVLDVAYSAPTYEGGTHPIAYPAEGQIGVPTTWVSPADLFTVDSPTPPVQEGRAYGYPITLTVGGAGGTDANNPYNLQVLMGATLTDSLQGVVEAYTFTPSNLNSEVVSLQQTAVVVPARPLEPSTKYVLTMRIGWNGVTEDVSLSFTTAE